jgi:hypothetical protein
VFTLQQVLGGLLVFAYVQCGRMPLMAVSTFQACGCVRCIFSTFFSTAWNSVLVLAAGAPADEDRHGHTLLFEHLAHCCLLLSVCGCCLQVRQLMEKMDMDHDGNVGGDEFLATLIDWGQVRAEAR